MNSADIIRRMIEAGCPADLIADVALLAGEVSALERRRAADAQRQKDKRERDRGDGDSHVTSRDSRDVTDEPLDKEKSPTPPKEINLFEEKITTPRARKGSASAFPCPDGVDPQHWEDFLANRKAKRLTNTPTAHRGILKSISELSDDEWPPGRLVQFAAENGWGSINDPRTSYRSIGNGNRPHHDRKSGWLNA
ncbi:hypothetical protein IC614_02975 [Allosphingosinicella flava]|uniref:Uncharacterized protein n=1 Tax=Allosphingosinicella flava TaxID=2771430 RepID=A0A7T2GKK9_9SPHN|nr:hypothetical protein [Sphingosinicella flava]QPQ55581.1 hypothetical protein IC614_02975 [Sphingosinicella flava]